MLETALLEFANQKKQADGMPKHQHAPALSNSAAALESRAAVR
jgi:hypothetical protein